MNFLERNLLALERTQPKLAERLCWPVSTEHIRDYGDGRVDYLSHLSTLALDLPEQELPPIEFSADESAVLLFGVGLGEQLRVILASPNAPDCVHVWEDDPWLLRKTLEHIDLRAQLFSGRVVLHLGVDLAEHRNTLRPLHRIKHPILQYLYTKAEAFLDETADTEVCLMCHGGLFVEDCSFELAQRGYQIYPWNSERLSPEELEYIIEVLSPKLLFAINYRIGFQEVARKHGIPVICWEIDPSLDALPQASAATTTLFVFSYRQASVNEFRRCGFENATFLPLATSPTRRHPLREAADGSSPYQVQVAFVGASMYHEGLARIDDFQKLYRTHVPDDHQVSSEELKLTIDSLIAEQRLKPTEYVIEALIAERLPELAAAYSSREGLVIPAQLLAEMCAAQKRFDYLAALGHHKPVVWGDDGWEAASQIDYRGLAGHHQEITLIYSNATINIDIGRIYQNEIITMRVFDVLACEGFLLTEYNPAIAECFKPGHDLETYQSLEELCDKAQYYLAHPERAREIARRGRQTIESKHTFSHRFDTIFSECGIASQIRR